MGGIRDFCATSILGLALATLGGSASAKSSHYSVLHTFQGGATDGQYPQYGSPAVDKDGNVYGVTSQGGANNLGVVYKIAADGTFSVLHSFDGTDGNQPYGGLTYDQATKTLYGTTYYGGTGDDVCGGIDCGVVYSLKPSSGVFKVLHKFTGKDGEGIFPLAAPIRAADGNLYGTTNSGGVGGYGTIWKLTPKGKLTELQSFNYANGAYPSGGLLMNQGGNLYGVLYSGTGNGFGGIYQIAADGTYAFLYSFTCATDGCQPIGRPVQDSSGNLYGTTVSAGTGNGGTAWKLAPDNTLSVVHAFSSSDPLGYNPDGGLVLLKNKLYGTTPGGGASNGGQDCPCGTVYRMGLDGSGATVLHDFMGNADAAVSYSELVSGPKKFLYGDTYHGGPGNVGAVFRLKQ